MKIPKIEFVYDRRGQASNKKSAVVEVRISYGGQRKYISTGIKLLKKEWSNGSVVCRTDWKELNEQLQLYRKRCAEIVVAMMDEGKIDLAAIPGILKERLVQQDTFLAYAKDLWNRKKSRVSDGTKRHYKVFFDFMDEWKGIVYFCDVTEKNVQKLDDKLSGMKLKEVSRWNYHKKLKMFIQKAVEDGLVKTNPYKRMDIKRGGDDGLRRCLTPEEFKLFEKCTISTPHLERVRDLFVFQTYTMMGYSDLKAFDYRKCEKLNGQMVYRSNRVKTDQPFTIVLLKPALDILSKYNYHLPIITNERYNEYLKEAVGFAHITKPVSTHWARHTGATLLINAGIPMHIIQHILGHSTIRETERTYAKVLDSTIVETMATYQSGEKEKSSKAG